MVQQTKNTVAWFIPPLPECNHHTLLKLIQLDLETHPPRAAVIALHMQAL